MTQIRVKDFGPIAEASFELKPLTVFMGPNGTGKSYLALAAYCLFRTLADEAHSGIYSASSSEVENRRKQAVRVARRIREEIKKAWPTARMIPSSPIRMQDLPSGLQHALLEYYDATGDELTSEFASEVERCYGTKVGDLNKRGPLLSATQLRIDIQDSLSKFRWGMAAIDGILSTQEWSVDSFKEDIDWERSAIPWRDFIEDTGLLFVEPLARRTDIIPEELYLKVHHMPSSRSGILLGHKTLAALIVGQASRAWQRPFERPGLPGAITDLIQALLLMGRPSPQYASVQAAIDFLEGSVTKGRVDLESTAEYPEVFYQNESGTFSLLQVSSMVSEIAPIVLYLKYLVRPGDLLIIEEPESHLDAENQRRFARAIAMLVNAGVQVLITTHSDFFVSQLNNLLLLSEVSRRRRAARKYAANEVLHPDTVGAYQFNPDPDGTIVETLHVTADGGIPITPFTDAHGAIYDEAISLEHAST